MHHDISQNITEYILAEPTLDIQRQGINNHDFRKTEQNEGVQLTNNLEHYQHKSAAKAKYHGG
jgi:hypothetical protein